MKRWQIAGLALLAGLVALAGCGKRAAEEPAADAKSTAPEKMQVRLGEATEVTADETLAVTGSIFAATDVNIAAKIPGRVVAIGADDGARVGAGRVLVQLDSRAAQADLRRARGALSSARAAYEKVRLNQALVETSADTGLRQAQADVSAARARLAQASEAAKLASTRSGSQGVDIAQADLAVESSRSRLEQARKSLEMTRSKADTDLTGATAAVAQAQSAVQQAQVAVGQAETALQLAESTTSSNLENARQAVVAAQNSLQILETGARSQEKAQAQSQVSAAQAALTTAQIEYDRAKNLFEHGAVAKAALDGATLVLQTRKEALQQAQQALSLVNEGPRSEQVRIAQAQLAQAQEQQRLLSGTRDKELTLRRQDLERAREGVSTAKEGVKQAQANLTAATTAKAQVPIAEQNVAQAEQGLSQAEQAARLAKAGVGQAEIARQEVIAAQKAVAAAEERLRQARQAAYSTPRINREDILALLGQVRQAEAAVSAASVAVSDHVVVAPLPGSIAEKKVEVGEVVNPGQTLYRLVSDGMVRFDALVPEEKVRFVNVGSSVAVKVDAVPDEQFVGRVIEILPAADLRSRTFTVKVGVPNVSGRLREGMFARGQITVQRNRKSIRVPAEAVVSRQDRSFVVRLEGANRAVPTEVTTGAQHGASIELLSGQILPGDRVITEGAATIEQETTVEVITDQPAAATPEKQSGSTAVK
ncbi:MAG: efflux RND transporter periplasmic adaptor subunit [Fimbriimonadaceae bacterium]|nr:efflux RND transporter periplasmic adaptor subunit [Fimbriimonadaceae bacterium]